MRDLSFGLEDEDTLQDADLRRCEADPLRVVHEMLHPLDELGVGVAGMMIPPAGCRAASPVVPVLCPGFHSLVSAYE